MGIGNDVLDLSHRSCRARARDDRLLDRILDRSEREWLEREEPNGPWHLPLWALWAAKEAAFKASNKTPGAPAIFSPRRLVCEIRLSPLGPGGKRSDRAMSLRGEVRGETLPEPVSVRGTSDGEHLHVVAWTTNAAPNGSYPARVEAGVERLGGPPDVATLRDRFTDAEWDGVYSRSSAAVRLEARARLRAMMAREARDRPPPRTVEIVTSRPGRTPPSVRIDGQEVAEWDLSMSHHGRYVAWALARNG